MGRPDFTAKKARRIKATTKERKNARLVEPPGSSERGEMGMARWRAHARERGSERVSELLSERAVERFTSSAVVLMNDFEEEARASARDRARALRVRISNI